MVLIFILFMLSCGVALQSMQKDQSKFADFVDRDVAALQADANLYAQGLQIGQALRNIVLAPGNKTAYANYEEASREFDASLKTAFSLAGSDEAAQKKLKEIEGLRKKQAAVQAKIIAQASTGQAAAMEMLNNEETR